MDNTKQKILVVDDTPENLDVLKGILQADYTLFFAINGSLALKIAKAQSPDLILLDIMMPDLDGYGVLRSLKADPRTAAIPVIFVTAKDDPADEFKGFELGCVDYIKKPFSPAIVVARVRTHLALSHTRQRLARQNDELKQMAKLREDVERISRHDLKNPLTAIFSGVYFLEIDSGLGHQAKEHLKMINEAAQDMLNMINASLDLFKMEQNIYVPEFVDVDVIHTIHRIEKALSPLISAKSSRIVIDQESLSQWQEQGFTVKGEPLLIYSMLANLLKNALEATPAGSIVTVYLEAGKAMAEIRIHNLGAVPEPLQDTIFEKFATYGKKSGTGLGTYSAKLISNTLGGDISMSTSKDNGTTFTVRLKKGGCDKPL